MQFSMGISMLVSSSSSCLYSPASGSKIGADSGSLALSLDRGSVKKAAPAAGVCAPWSNPKRSRALLSHGDSGSRLRNGHDLSGRIGLPTGPPGGRRRERLKVQAAGEKNGNTGEDPVETLFMKELRRRGIPSDAKGIKSLGTAKPGSERDWPKIGGPKTEPLPKWTEAQNDEQLKRSMALNSEGLDGLIPRATELLKLGGTFWVGFWPFIVMALALFVATYVYFGPAFLHTGDSIYPGGRPPYVEPYQLLQEETIPPGIGPDRVPFRPSPSP